MGNSSHTPQLIEHKSPGIFGGSSDVMDSSGEYTFTVDEMPGKLIRHEDRRSQGENESFKVLCEKNDNTWR